MFIKSILFASVMLIGAPSESTIAQNQSQTLSSAQINELLTVNRQECTLIRDLGGGVCEYQCPGIPGTIHALCGTL